MLQWKQRKSLSLLTRAVQTVGWEDYACAPW